MSTGILPEAPPSSLPSPAISRPIRIPRQVLSLVGPVAVIALWWLAADTVFSSAGTVPTPWEVLTTIYSDGWSVYGPNVSVTASTAMEGFLWGTILAIATAVVVTLLHPLEPIATQLSIVSYCTPLLALGPLILVVFGGTAPSVFLAAISVYFTTMVGTLNGLKSADARALELVTVYGGGPWATLRRVQLISAIPHIFAAMKIGAPAAVLGAILGEYLGGVDRGIGVALTAAQSSFEVARTWGMAVAAGALAGAGYLIFAAVESLITRRMFSGEVPASAQDMTAAEGKHPFVDFAIQILSAATIVIVLWWGFLQLFPQVSGRVGRSPLDVLDYLGVSSNRSLVVDELMITVKDSLIGFTAGMLAALLAASTFMLLPAVRSAVMPVATLLRAVPLVALAPLIVLVFGRGTATIAVLGGLVVFFPALVIIGTGLSSVATTTMEVATAYGATSWQRLRMVSVPSAVPSLLLAARMSVPASLVGALIAEWLGTGRGLGSSMIKAIPAFDYDQLWSSIAAVIAVSVVAYALVGVIERGVIRMMQA